MCGVDEPLATTSIRPDKDLLPALAAFVREVAEHEGLEGAGVFADVVAEVCLNSIEHGYEDDATGTVAVTLTRRADKLVAVVADQGLPFDYRPLAEGADARLEELVRAGGADRLHFLNRGRDGNCVEIIRRRPAVDVRAGAPAAAEPSPPVPADTELSVRAMRPSEAEDLARCVYRSYGYSYDWEDIYFPERVRALQEAGRMRSVVAVAPDGSFVGHLALRFQGADAAVAEVGQAVVDPRYRGHHIFPRMKTFLSEEAQGRGLLGLFSEATAAHPGSQKANLHLGAVETGFLLGYIPASVSYAAIDTAEIDRKSVALMYLKVGDHPPRRVHLPPRHAAMIERIYARLGIERAPSSSAGAPTGGETRIDVEVRADHNTACLSVASLGDDWVDRVASRVEQLCRRAVDCVYLDLSLHDPRPAAADEALHRLGFRFGCIVPELRDGDVLRLQLLNGIDPDPARVATASDFGKTLLEYVASGLRSAHRTSAGVPQAPTP